MSDQEKKEQEIMNQEMSTDEMETVAGGASGFDEMELKDRKNCKCRMGAWATCSDDTSRKYGRPLYRPDGSVNCSATVEDGSWCQSDDACYNDESVYFGMTECEKAWK